MSALGATLSNTLNSNIDNSASHGFAQTFFVYFTLLLVLMMVRIISWQTFLILIIFGVIVLYVMSLSYRETSQQIVKSTAIKS
jgi:hypothetical protein